VELNVSHIAETSIDFNAILLACPSFRAFKESFEAWRSRTELYLAAHTRAPLEGKTASSLENLYTRIHDVGHWGPWAVSRKESPFDNEFVSFPDGSIGQVLVTADSKLRLFFTNLYVRYRAVDSFYFVRFFSASGMAKPDYQICKTARTDSRKAHVVSHAIEEDPPAPMRSEPTRNSRWSRGSRVATVT
jgi:hypothetical protein